MEEMKKVGPTPFYILYVILVILALCSFSASNHQHGEDDMTGIRCWHTGYCSSSSPSSLAEFGEAVTDVALYRRIGITCARHFSDNAAGRLFHFRQQLPAVICFDLQPN